MGRLLLGAVDIGGTKIAVGLVNENGELLAQEETPVQVELGFLAAMQRVVDILDRLMKQVGGAIQGIGIGCTGPIDPFTGQLEDVNTLPGWSGSNPVNWLSDHYGVTVAMENDADAAALAEACWGSGSGKQRFICITVGTGIGSGILIDGVLYRGVNQSHPELGHHILDPRGPHCTCGATGCWEAMAAGPALEQLAYELAPAEIKASRPSAAEICQRAREGEDWAVKTIEQVGRYLGMGLANVITIFLPDCIALGGSVMKSADLFMPVMWKVIQENCRLVPFRDCEITLARLGPEVGLIGAAQVWRHRFQPEVRMK